MKKIDFSSLRRKIKILTDQDVFFLNNFFNDFKILKILKEIEQKRKKYLLIIIGAFIIAAVLIVIVLNTPVLNKTNSDGDSIGGYIIPCIIILFMVLFGTLKAKFKSAIKGKILSKLVEDTKLNVEYNSIGTFFNENFKTIAEKTKLIKPYDRLDFKEDSIKIDEKEKGFLITGTEFQTSKESRDSKGRKRYTVNNHAYIMKIQFHNPKFKVDNSITLLSEINNLISVILTWIIFIGLLIGAIIIGDIIWIIFGIYIAILVGIYFYKKSKNKNRIRLENIDFEKEFNVFSNDKILSRQVLNPAFMYRIYDYVNKVNKNRKYSFFIEKDYIYVKHEIAGDFLEISFFKSLFRNLKDYVEFYLEIKNIGELSTDLKLCFYDKGFSSKNIIK